MTVRRSRSWEGGSALGDGRLAGGPRVMGLEGLLAPSCELERLPKPPVSLKDLERDGEPRERSLERDLDFRRRSLDLERDLDCLRRSLDRERDLQRAINSSQGVIPGHLNNTLPSPPAIPRVTVRPVSTAVPAEIAYTLPACLKWQSTHTSYGGIWT